MKDVKLSQGRYHRTGQGIPWPYAPDKRMMISSNSTQNSFGLNKLFSYVIMKIKTGLRNTYKTIKFIRIKISRDGYKTDAENK